MQRIRVIPLFIILTLLLFACGKKEASEQVKGDWQVEVNGIATLILTFHDRKMEMYTVPNENTQRFDYNVSTNDDDKTFTLKVIDRDIDVQEKLLNGIFKNKNQIELTYLAGVSQEMLDEENVVMKRINNVEKEKEKAVVAYKKNMTKLEKQNEKLASKKQQEHNKQLAKEEQKQPENKLEDEEIHHIEPTKLPEKPEKVKGASTLQEKYKLKSQTLEHDIMSEQLAVDPYAQDIDLMFYGQYFTDWDDLLQEVWDILRQEMPEDEFEVLKAEQIEWINAKEEAYGDDPGYASGRAMQEGELTIHTQSRVNELIENYLK